MVKIYLIRHGESLGNAKKMLLGHTDLALSELGERQAYLAAEALKNERIDAIYSSDLLRAYQTALPQAQAHGLDVIKTAGLREIFLGDWEGISYAPLKERGDPAYCVEFKKRFGYFTAPGGESTEALGERIYKEIERIAKENDGKTLILTCHAAAIRCFFGKVLGLDKERLSTELPFPENASYSTVTYENGRFSFVDYSRDEHLLGLAKNLF